MIGLADHPRVFRQYGRSTYNVLRPAFPEGLAVSEGHCNCKVRGEDSCSSCCGCERQLCDTSSGVECMYSCSKCMEHPSWDTNGLSTDSGARARSQKYGDASFAKSAAIQKCNPDKTAPGVKSSAYVFGVGGTAEEACANARKACGEALASLQTSGPLGKYDCGECPRTCNKEIVKVSEDDEDGSCREPGVNAILPVFGGHQVRITPETNKFYTGNWGWWYVMVYEKWLCVLLADSGGATFKAKCSCPKGPDIYGPGWIPLR